MKKSLLFFLVLPLFAGAQSTIYSLSGGMAAQPTDDLNARSYDLISFAAGPNEATGGMNLTWNFTGVANVYYKNYSNAAPSSGELTTFPGTTMTSTGTLEQAPAFTDRTYLNASDAKTGVITDEYTIYYDTDTASFGTFPLTYGDLSVDTVAGSYFYDGYSGTFAGTMISEVDAYGTLSFSYGNPPAESASVTRLKTVETLQLSYPGFGVVGTYVQTTYRYYVEGLNWPYLKSTRTDIDIPILEIDSDETVYEKSPLTVLSVDTPIAHVPVSIYPNPVTAEALVSSDGTLLSVTVADMTGKTVLSGNHPNLDFGALSAGMYLVKVITDKGAATTKILKR